MKICLLGKYPPIEGGVSGNTYWLARGLAERGHEIHVVTNAEEVEDRYRLALAAEDASWYQPRFEGGGSVRVYNAEPFTRHAMEHIPTANPFVSKLASLATDVVRRHGCGTILAYYFEPYAVAGWLASRWTNRPLIIKHAGSDLDRLCRVPDLATTYKEILRSADLVVTQPRLMPRFLGMGVDRQRLERDIPYALPREVFKPEGESLDIARTAIAFGGNHDGAQNTVSAGRIPAIGVYGKIGFTKGTFDLIASLGDLVMKGLAFRFVAMIGGPQGESLMPALRDARIEDRSFILPMLPNWRVPEFIRACTAVCFLERDFPIAIHGPVIPREVLACGTCLVLSDEIASKQRYRDKLLPGENVLIVKDPRDRAELTATLRLVLSDQPRARVIGEQGVQVSRWIERNDVYISGWEALLARSIRSVLTCSVARASGGTTMTATTAFESLIPDLVAFLCRACPSVVADFVAGVSAESPFDAAIRFCDFVAERIDYDNVGADLPKIMAAMSYAKERLISSYDPVDDATAVFPVVDVLAGARVTRESAWTLRPVRGNSVRILSFDYDVSAVSILSSAGGHEPAVADGADLAGVERGSMLVLFHRSANLIPCELRIDEATRQLVDRCDGTLTTSQLVEEMCRYFGADSQTSQEEVLTRVCGVLDRLYRLGVLVFAEYREGWGWAGGDRTLEEHPTHGVDN